MATRAAPAYVGTRQLSKQFQAKCEANQPLVEVIAAKKEKVSSSNYGYTLKKAAEAICKVKTPITNYEELTALKGVGPTIATMLGFSKSFAPQKENNGASKKPRAKKNSQKKDDSDAATINSSSMPLSKKSAPPIAARQKQSKQTRLEGAETICAVKEKPTRKELAYQRAVQESESWKGRGLTWRLVLLIDQRERKAEHYASKVEQCGIPTEIRSLPIGDMCWIAQGFKGSIDDKQLIAELMLGTIIERKEVADLKSSLFGTRYHEQQLRLKDSGQPQVIFLVEGDTKKDLYRCPAETLHTTMWAIRIEKQNQVIQTAHTEETVQTLRRMHRRMLQRTFPTAFYAEALPGFSGPDAGGRRGRQRDSFGEQRRKRRRRLESLHGLSFDEEPIPMAGMSRFVTYKELRAKVERDREAGRRTVGSIHQAMLKQVATISDVKILPVSGEYPTANSLLQAYDDTRSHSERKKLLEGLDISSGAPSQKALGPRSSAELYIAYGLDGSGRESAESAASGSSYLKSVATYRAEVAARQSGDSGLQKAAAESTKVSDRAATQTSVIDEHSSTFPESVPRPAAVAASSGYSSGRSASGSSKEARPKPKPPVKKPPPIHDMVDLLSSDDDDAGLSTNVNVAPPAKRRRSGVSLTVPLASTGQTNNTTAKHQPVPLRKAHYDPDSSDDELDALLGSPLYKKSANCKSAEVIEID